MNQFKKEPEEQPEETQSQPKDPKIKGKLIDMTDTGLMKGELRRYFPFIFFLAGLAIIHIYNSHLAIKTVRRCDELNKEIKEARAEYISVKSEFMFRSKQSQVAKRLEGTGLMELTQPPIKITETEEDRDER